MIQNKEKITETKKRVSSRVPFINLLSSILQTCIADLLLDTRKVENKDSYARAMQWLQSSSVKPLSNV